MEAQQDVIQQNNDYFRGEMSQFMKNIEKSITEMNQRQTDHIVESKQQNNDIITKQNIQFKETSDRLDKIEKKVIWIYAWSAGAAAVVSLILYILFNIWGKFK